MVKNFLIFLMLYVFLHNPLFQVLNGMGSIKLLYILLLLLIIENKGLIVFFTKYKHVVVSLILIFLYTAIRSVFYGDSLYMYTTIVSIIEILLIPYCIVHFFLLRNKKKDLFNFIFFLSSFAAVLTIIFFFNESANYFSRFVLQMPEEKLLYDFSRSFGISEDLAFSYGIIQGVVVAIWLTKYKDYPKYIIFIPLILFSALINARTGVITPVLFAIYYAITKRKFSLLFTIAFLLGFSFLVFSLFDFSEINPATYQWLNDFIDELTALMDGRKSDSNTVNLLTGKLFVLPETSMQWLFGRGVNLFGRIGLIHSDVGYILQLNYGGLCYVSLLILFLFSVFKIQKKSLDKDIIVAFLILFLIANFKGPFLLNTGGVRLIMLLTIYSFELKKKSSKCLK